MDVYPFAPCMEYLPTFAIKFEGNVDKHATNGKKTAAVEPGAHEQTTEMAALAGLGSPKVAADPLYRPETLPTWVGSTHTGKPKVERTGQKLLWTRKRKKTQKTQNIGVSCVVGWGGQLWSSNLSLAIGCSAQSRYFFFLLLWEILPGKLQRERIGEGRVFGVCSSWPCV